MIFPSSLQTLTFGNVFNQSLAGVALPNNLQTLNFEDSFNQSFEGVALPSGLQKLTFGDRSRQQLESLEGVLFPSDLQQICWRGLSKGQREVRHFWQICHSAAALTLKTKRCLGLNGKWTLLARACPQLFFVFLCTIFLFLRYYWYPIILTCCILLQTFCWPLSVNLHEAQYHCLYLNVSLHPPISLILFVLQTIWSVGFPSVAL